LVSKLAGIIHKVAIPHGGLGTFGGNIYEVEGWVQSKAVAIPHGGLGTYSLFKEEQTKSSAM
jgi:hypothetical protein